MRVGVRRRRGCVRAGQPRSGHKTPVGESHIIGPRRAGVRGAGGRRSAQAKPSQHHSVRGAEPRPPRSIFLSLGVTVRGFGGPFPGRPSMAPHATVLVALRRQSSF